MSSEFESTNWTAADAGFPVGEQARADFADLETDVAPIEGRIGAVWEYNGSPELVIIETDEGDAVVAFDRVEMIQ